MRGWLVFLSRILLLAACADRESAARLPAESEEPVTLARDVEPVTRAEDAQPNTFIPPFRTCREPNAGETGAGPDGKVCTNVAISGCTELGHAFAEYGSCEVVRTQRPFWERPPAAETRSDDPRLSDRAFMRELGWAAQQVEACGCVCCHDSSTFDGKFGEWDIRRGPIWLDSLSDSGLALFVGLADSSVLGAYPREDNFGFDRTSTGLPTDDTPRLKAFLEQEMARRGLSADEARAVPPFGGPIYENRVRPPDRCSEIGAGIGPDSTVQFPNGPARYVYVLAEGSQNPGVPPNLDRPDGTLWRLDVLANSPALAAGFRYGTTPNGSFQALPEQGDAPKLERGETYQLHVLRDVGVPIANCSFEFGEPVTGPPAAGGGSPGAAGGADAGASTPGAEAGACSLPGGDADGFGAACKDGTNHRDCTCKADYCALMPGQTQGTCTVQGCKDDPGLCPAGYSCFDLSAFSPGLPSICTKS